MKQNIFFIDNPGNIQEKGTGTYFVAGIYKITLKINKDLEKETVVDYLSKVDSLR